MPLPTLTPVTLAPLWNPRDYAQNGNRFGAVMGNGSTFLAPVTAYPTTTLTMALWNGEVGGGKNYYIDEISAFQASGTAAAGGTLIYTVTKVAQARPTLSTGQNGGYASTIVGGLSGQGSGATKAVFINAITATGEQSLWLPGDVQPANTTGATIAASVFRGQLYGGVKVPPGYMLGLAVITGAGTTPLYGFGVVWCEDVN